MNINKKMITKHEIKKIVKRLIGGYHDLIRLDSLRFKCKKCNTMFECPCDWIDSIGISEWYGKIFNEKCRY